MAMSRHGGRTMVTRAIFSTVFIQLDDGVTCEHPHPEKVPKFTHVELFSGIGGFDVAAEFFGIPTVLAVDRNIHTISYHRNTVGATINSFPPSAVCGRIQNPRIMGQSCKLQPGFMPGGFPCQPFSQMGFELGPDDHQLQRPRCGRLYG